VKRKGTKLSLCMMVRDEEANLPRCLNSLRNFVDEIVIVDTGSTDRTVETGLLFHARVHRHPWEGDFAVHRNQSIGYATGDWILVMDADEELEKGSGSILREALGKARADVLSVTVRSLFNGGASSSRENKVRVFRNQPHIRYAGIVHEQLRGFRTQEAVPITIRHYGYDLSPEGQQKKFVRTSSLLKRQIADEPESYWHRHNLAVAYATNAMYEDAVREGMEAVSLAERQGLGGPNPIWTYYIVSASHLKLGDLASAEEAALKAVRICGDHPDPRFILTLVYHRQKRWDEMGVQTGEYFRILEEIEEDPGRFENFIVNMADEGWRVHLALGDLHLHRDALALAWEHFQESMAGTPSPHECLKIIGDCYKGRGLWEQAADFYRRSTEKKGDFLEARLGLGLCLNRLGLKPEARRVYEQALDLNPDCTETLLALANLLYEQGAEEPAGRLYEKALAAEPRLIQAALRLARLSVKRGDLESCVRHCESSLKGLGLGLNRTLESPSDLADLFLIIGHELDGAGRMDLFREAVEVAVAVDPNLLHRDFVAQG
jgi:tetratricopeptide (TPR) repeat protein